MKRFFALVAASFALSVSANPLSAAPVIVSSNPGSTVTTDALTGFSTSGDGMVGMSVTAYFSNSTSQTLAWAATGPGAGGVSGLGWSLNMSGDTFGGIWSLSNTSGQGLLRVVLDGGPGLTVFDRTNPSFGTNGSAQGLDFNETSNSAFPITATYQDEVALTGFPAVGDLFRVLDIRFTGQGGLTGDSSITFQADTDNATTALQPVPEPATMAVLGVLTLSAFGVRRRLKKAVV